MGRIEVAHNAVGIVGNVISFGLFISPVPTFLRIIQKNSVEEFKPDPYLATILNCMFWVFYGMPFVHPDSILIVTINAIGLGLELIFICIFFAYCSNQTRKKITLVLLLEVIFAAAVVVLTLLLVNGTNKRTLIVGIIGDVFNVMMYASPLTVMAKVIKTKSVEYMPFSLSLANFLNGSIWVAYALIKFDMFVLICNGFGVLSGIVQLVLYAWYYKTTPKDDGPPRLVVTQLSTRRNGENGF